MAMSAILIRAIEEYENENSLLSEYDKYMLLGEALYKNITSKLIRLKNAGKPGQVSEEDELIQIECWKLHKEMGTLLERAKKASKATGKTEEDWKKQFNDFIQSHKPSMSSIVRNIADKAEAV